MGLFEGLLGGFNERRGEVETRNRDEAERAANREAAIFSSLMQADDPEVRSLALAGLLDSAKPRKKKGGLRGWIGEMESSPYMPQIQSLINTPVTEHKQIQLPGEATRPGLPGPIPGMDVVKPTIVTPPAGGAPASAGMSPTPMIDSKTQSAGPPPPQSYTQPPPIPYTVQKPRQVFLSPEDKMMQTELAKGRVGEEVKIQELMAIFGGDRTRAIEFRRREREAEIQYRLRMGAGGAAGMNYAEGEVVPDTSSPTGYVQIMYRRGNPQDQYRMPAAPPTSATRSFGQTLESLSQSSEFGGLPYAQQTPEMRTVINTRARELEVSQAGAVAGERAMATALAEAAAPLSRMDRLQATQSLRDDWLKVDAPHRLVQVQQGVLDSAEAQLRMGNRQQASEQIIVTFEKMLDALSVVRESEYLRPAYNQSLFDRIQGAYDRMTSGGAPLTTEQLQGYLSAARQMAKAAMQDYAKHRVAIERTAREATIDPANIFGDMRPTTPPPAPGSGASAAPATAPVNGPPAPGGNGYAVGEEVMYDGKRHRVIAIRPDGQVDLEVIP